MKHFDVVLCALCCIVVGHSGAENVELTDCGSNGDIQVQELTLSPQPLTLSDEITFSAALKTNVELTNRLSVHLNITVDNAMLGHYSLPCVELTEGLSLGSCTYNLCGMIKWLLGTGNSCGEYFDQLGYSCTCPIPEGTYTFPRLSVKPNLPPSIHTLVNTLKMAKVTLKVIITDDVTESTLLCKEGTITIVKSEPAPSD